MSLENLQATQAAYEEAKAAFEAKHAEVKKFHNEEPTVAKVVRVPDGKPGVTRKVVVALGYVPETHYFVPEDWKSSKNGPHYVHPHPEGGEPLEVLDPETGLTSKIPGPKTRVTDWWRD